ncbi:hypothetical protein BWI17_02300 [Betaproteobacteria bacterium GR16-43]|nr:hypothetical protein BWI17_02300 [Betaproteobacteria bacterium GR16-43]
MAVPRDYGGFSKACERHFAPMISKLGMLPLGGANFGRRRGRWIDGLFLQQSGYGSGDFCVNVGFNIPELSELWRTPAVFGLSMGGRLSAAGVGHDRWLRASNKAELLEGLAEFAKHLESAMPWFDETQTFDDLVERYRRVGRIGSSPPTAVSVFRQLDTTNYGFLLFLAGKPDESKAWLEPVHATLTRTPRYITKDAKILYEKAPGARLFKLTKDELHQLGAIEAVLART